MTRVQLRRILRNASLVTLLAAACPAVADSGVTLYGLFDTSVEITHNGNSTTTRMDSGSARGSRFGLRGGEALGGGTRAIFELENGFGSDDGTFSVPGTLFNRQAWIGASGGWGELRMGRQPSPLYLPAKGALDAFGAGTMASGLNNFSTITPYINKAVRYRTPELGGLSAIVMVGLRDDTMVQRTQVNNFHAVLDYRRGPLNALVAMQEVHDASGTGVTRAYFGGGSYRLGNIQLFAAAYAGRQTANLVHKNVYSVSARYYFAGASSVALGYAYVADRAAGSGNADQISAMYRYTLSQRTELYATLSRLNNRGGAKYTMRGVTVTGIPPAYPGAALTGGQVGVLHRF